MSSITPSRVKYADYSVLVADDFDRDVYYDEAAGGNGELIRVHYRVSRVPSRKEFKIRNFRNATEEDRKHATSRLEQIHISFRRWELEDAVYRKWSKSEQVWFFTAHAGRVVEDPLVQLELEMMIDLDTRTTSGGLR